MKKLADTAFGRLIASHDEKPQCYGEYNDNMCSYRGCITCPQELKCMQLTEEKDDNRS